MVGCLVKIEKELRNNDFEAVRIDLESIHLTETGFDIEAQGLEELCCIAWSFRKIPQTKGVGNGHQVIVIENGSVGKDSVEAFSST